ncbi:hypothetical protein ACFQ3A_09565 [Sphaerisporangium aureirubrum]
MRPDGLVSSTHSAPLNLRWHQPKVRCSQDNPDPSRVLAVRFALLAGAVGEDARRLLAW